MIRTFLTVAALALAIVAGTSAAGNKQAIGEFLSDCKTDAKVCSVKIGDVIQAAKNARYACVPRELSLDEATQQELGWLQKSAADNEHFAGQDTEDALFEGVSRLWPCGKG